MRDTRRLFASVPAGQQVLTVNGLEFDYVHYRHNPDGVASVIENNHCFVSFAKRLQEDGKVFVTIRVWECDIDMIEILDDLTGEWHPMWSTDPDYTGGLSRWEHHHYMDFLAARDRGRARQRGRINAKAKQEILRSFDEDLYKLGIRARGNRFALIEAEEERRQKLDESGRDEGRVDPADIKSWPIQPGGLDRQDIPSPPPQKGGGGKKKRENTPPSRGKDYGLASTASLTRSQSDSPEKIQEVEYKFKRRRPSK